MQKTILDEYGELELTINERQRQLRFINGV